MSSAITVVVVDDHPMFRAGVIATLGKAPDIEIVGEGGSAEEAVALSRRLLPDITLLDISMPGGGIAAARAITTSAPAVRVVMLTVSEDDDDLLAAMKAGASGYVLKGTGASELIKILRSVDAGDVYVAPTLAWRMLQELSEPEPGPFDQLTPRERDVLRLVAAGLSNQEVGHQLGLTEKTVKHYMTNILGKLQVRSRVEAALLAQREGLGGLRPDR